MEVGGKAAILSHSPPQDAHLHRDTQLYLKSRQLFRKFTVPEKLQSWAVDRHRHHHNSEQILKLTDQK